ncbi:MAG: RecX family transcriptional regulator [Ignavibacteria bacterium]
MKITKIEKQKKDSTRYNLYIDGEFGFGLYEDTILIFGLRSGDEIEEEKIKEIREQDEFNFGKKISYSFLSYRQRSKKELTKKLKEKKISEVIIDKIIKLLEDQKYIDDSSFAKLFLESKIRSKPLGKRLLQIKLFEKGIDKETAENMLKENYSEEKELESAIKLYRKYSGKVKAKDSADKKQKCYRYLISRGFSFEIAGKVVNVEENE